MAKLTTCKDCGHQVSKNATQCPNCGAKIKRSSPILNIIVGIILFSIVWASDKDAFIKKLKTSKKVIIEAPFFQEPRTQFDFDIAGLE